ncbi:MAG: hypothetical protein CM15mP84_03340 [Cellvibrionales bacterium]|nr:MAG: hypothetical protein CM15mP84_03340 [Cellvibrionales bacterium]
MARGADNPQLTDCVSAVIELVHSESAGCFLACLALPMMGFLSLDTLTLQFFRGLTATKCIWT